MKFFYISHPRRNPNITKSIKAACQTRELDFIHINPARFDFTDDSNIPNAGDILFRSSTVTANDGLARTIERYLIHDKVATLYTSYERAISQYPQSYVIHAKHNLPVPTTIWNVPKERQLIAKYVDAVGGFPVIIKATGGSHGVGVMKIDSPESLYSVIDYLNASKIRVIMRQFINARQSARHIILNGQVLASIEYSAPSDDFRTNVGVTPQVKPKQFSSHINDLAIKAVNTMGYEFGGVDILIDEDNKPYITEINFPCNFARAEKATGTDISGPIVDHLINKARHYA